MKIYISDILCLFTWHFVRFFLSYMSPPKSPGCSDVFEPEFDLIYTDYTGFTYMLMHITPNLSPYMWV